MKKAENSYVNRNNRLFSYRTFEYNAKLNPYNSRDTGTDPLSWRLSKYFNNHVKFFCFCKIVSFLQ